MTSFAAAPAHVPGCPLCEEAGGILVWRGGDQSGGWRVVRVPDADFPAFYRVVSEAHISEFSDLAASERLRCMSLVLAVEETLRAALAPTKINLASLGNAVPHLHWHVIARFGWDSHFPQPVWGERQRAVVPAAVERVGPRLAALDAALADALGSACAVEPRLDAVL